MGISIIIPCRNEAGYISTTLQSLEKQSEKSAINEVIIVDNGSTDTTQDVVNSYAETSSLNIQLISEPLPGVSRARNTGAHAAQATHLIFLDADIIASLHLIKEILKNITDGYQLGTIRNLSAESNFVGEAVFLIMESIKMLGWRPFGKCFISKELFLKIGGFNEQIALGENVEFLIRAFKQAKLAGYKTTHIKIPIYSSLRRFHLFGYTRVLASWFMAYLGKYKQTYASLNGLSQI